MKPSPTLKKAIEGDERVDNYERKHYHYLYLRYPYVTPTGENKIKAKTVQDCLKQLEQVKSEYDLNGI